MLGMSHLLFVSDQIETEDFNENEDEFNKMLVDNPLKSTFKLLRILLSPPGKVDLEITAKRSANAKKRIPEGSASHDSGPPASTSVPETPQRNVSTSSEFSATSYSQKSAHSTPDKLQAQETSVQPLQNAFAHEVLMHVFPGGDVPVRWPLNRRLTLRYVTYITYAELG